MSTILQIGIFNGPAVARYIFKTGAFAYPYPSSPPTPPFKIQTGSCFWWKSVKPGQWRYHPKLALCGPEGHTELIAGVGSYASSQIITLNGSRVTLPHPGGLIISDGGKLDKINFGFYHPLFDRSKGGNHVFVNNTGRDIGLFPYCNDGATSQEYEDNSGVIEHEIGIGRYV